MPWDASDANKHKKGLSKKQRKKWAAIANGALASCRESSGEDCEGRAVRIANSKFEGKVPFNPVINAELEGRMKKIAMETKEKKFQHHKTTPPDAMDGHVHEASYDEDGNGATSVVDDHHHIVLGFKVQNYYYFDPETREEYASVHPGSLAFKERKNEAVETGECEMEILRPGKHNGEEFTEKDLEEMASNFEKLKGELRPKLKITHRENQESLAGLSAYGDVVGVFLKKISDGTRRLFAKVSNVPRQVLEWIRERRFPERSIEVYPEFRLGTKEDSPVYRNVLKAVALLGHEMPAVTGMEPVRLEECLECQGTVCFKESFEEKKVAEEIPQGLLLAFQIAGERLRKSMEEVRQ